MVVYVSTWGDPSGWSEVTYKLPSKEIKSFSTIATYENPSKIILIVQDSVLTPQLRQRSDDAEKNKILEIVENCLKKERPSDYESLMNKVREYIKTEDPKRKKVINIINSCLKKEKPSDYESWVNQVKEYIKCVVKNALGEETLNKLSIIVVPAVGRIGNFNYGKIELNQGELPSYLYANIVETLLVQKLYEELKGVNDDEVVLDTTHGVNYLPIIAFRVLYNLTSLLDLKFKVINFVPTVFGQEYTYMEIFKREEKKNTFDLSQIKVGSSKDPVRRVIVKSLKLNAPLMVIERCKEKERKEFSEDYYQHFINNVKIENNEIKIKEKLQPDQAWVDVLSDYVCGKVKDNTKEGIEEFGEVLEKFSVNAGPIISREVNIIYNLAKGLKEGERKPYYEIYRMGGEEEEGRSKQLSKEELERNFIAHAGLLKEYVIVEKKNGKIYVYYDESKIGELLEKVFGEKLK